jgi:hypothetical protein
MLKIKIGLLLILVGQVLIISNRVFIGTGITVLGCLIISVP